MLTRYGISTDLNAKIIIHNYLFFVQAYGSMAVVFPSETILNAAGASQ